MRTAIACLAALMMLSACAGGNTHIITSARPGNLYATARVEHGDDAVIVDPKVIEYFETKLKGLLYSPQGGFKEGKELTLRYRFVQYAPGNRAKRYFIGFGAGRGKLTVQVFYLNPDGYELSSTEDSGQISMGFFGGSINEAVDEMAEKTVAYSTEHFAKK